MSHNTLSTELEQLSQSSLTTLSLSALDFIIPGSYKNVTNLEDMVREVTGETRVGRLQAIHNHIEDAYAEDSGAQRAVWLFKLTDSADKAVAAASFANKVGSKIGVLSFLEKMTPKADTSQALDLCLKLTVEALAFLSLHGLSRNSVSNWTQSIGKSGTYSNESALRIGAIIALDALIPLGPDFLKKISQHAQSEKSNWANNTLFKKISDFIPGVDIASKSGFVVDLVKNASGPIASVIDNTGLNREKVLGTLQNFTDVSDSKLDYLAAFLDASTNFVSHTGIQSVARHMVRKSAERFGYDK